MYYQKLSILHACVYARVRTAYRRSIVVVVVVVPESQSVRGLQRICGGHRSRIDMLIDDSAS